MQLCLLVKVNFTKGKTDSLIYIEIQIYIIYKATGKHNQE